MTKRSRNLLIILVLLATALIVDISFRPLRRWPKSLLGDSRKTVESRFLDIYACDLGIQNDTYWMGISICQTPMDMVAMQEVIWEVRPDLVIETGTLRGGSSLYFASLLHCMNPEGRVLTVDIKDQTAKVRKNPLFQKYVTTFAGSSVDKDIVSEIHRIAAGKRAVVFLDSDHHFDHVLKEMNAYADLVPIGSYMVVNDTFFHDHEVWAHFGPGPLEAVKKFLKGNTSFKNDSHKTRFMLTFHPEGYLKRVS